MQAFYPRRNSYQLKKCFRTDTAYPPRYARPVGWEEF
jgi:hypothetical protein